MADSPAEMPENRPLWAPWRIQYLRELHTPGCFLCHQGRPDGDDLAHHVIHRGATCYVLLNRYPYNSGHLLVAPYRHVGDLAELTDDEGCEIMALIRRGQVVLREAMHPEGFNAGCNLGRVAGAAVADHVHWHLVPRWAGDTNFMPVIGSTDCVPEALTATARLLRQHWG